MVDRSNKPPPLPATPTFPKAQPTVDYNAGAARVEARLPTGESVTILLHGATVISWKSGNGAENLWLSDKAILDGSKPVRGGIPVVFPVFGPPPSNHPTSSLPQHGFARSNRWEYLGKSSTEANNAAESASAADEGVKLDFGLYRAGLSDATKKSWPHDFALVYSVTLSQGGLQTMLNVRNEGTEAFDFQMLLHTYLRVDDVTKTTITGLAGTSYTDKVLDAKDSQQTDTTISITGETDRVYRSIPQNTTTVLSGNTPRFDVVRDNVDDTVVWNPWKEKAKAMGDFEPKEGYMKMLCVEIGSVSGWTKLEGGETWEGGQIIKSHL